MLWTLLGCVFLLGGKDDTPTPGDCEALDEVACDEDTGCMTMRGRPLQSDGAGGLCVDFSVDGEALACAPGGGCPAVESLARPAEGEDCWWFPSGCIPEGWMMCEQSTADECR